MIHSSVLNVSQAILNGEGLPHVASMNRLGKWNKKLVAYLEQVRQVIDALFDFWPLTLRQIYYRLVAAAIIENHINKYKQLSRVLAKARTQGLVPWEAMEDRSRVIAESPVWLDCSEFLTERLDDLDCYRRDRMQSQDELAILVIEKDALVQVCHSAASPYCVPVVPAKGFSSHSQKKVLQERIEVLTVGAERVRILYFGDMDPSGWWMLPDILYVLQEEFGLGDRVTGCRCGLTPRQIAQHSLPHDPTALKWSDSRAKRYVEVFGELAVELDAMSPPDLQALVRQAIEEHCDLSQFEAENEIEELELTTVAEVKHRFAEILEGLNE